MRPIFDDGSPGGSLYDGGGIGNGDACVLTDRRPAHDPDLFEAPTPTDVRPDRGGRSITMAGSDIRRMEYFVGGRGTWRQTLSVSEEAGPVDLALDANDAAADLAVSHLVDLTRSQRATRARPTSSADGAPGGHPPGVEPLLRPRL